MQHRPALLNASPSVVAGRCVLLTYLKKQNYSRLRNKNKY